MGSVTHSKTEKSNSQGKTDITQFDTNSAFIVEI